MADANSTLTDLSVSVACGGSNDYDGRIGLRISSIFVIGFGSFLGALLPIYLARTDRMSVPKLAFFIAKYFGSGVIVATAFIHLLAPATQALQSPCLSGPITDYPWAEGIALITVFSMFFIEILASRFDISGFVVSGEQDLEAAGPAVDVIGSEPVIKENASNEKLPYQDRLDKGKGKGRQENAPESSTSSQIPGHEGDLSYPPGGEHHLDHQKTHDEAQEFAAQMTAVLILEFGVIFHSIFIGLTLAVAGDEFNVLYIVLVFHQTFEGLGLGARLATTPWSKKRWWVPWALGSLYGVTTPVSIAVGLGVRASFAPSSTSTLLTNGIFDSISAGILLYTGLVELMAHEFMFNQEMREASIGMVLNAFGWMCSGAGLMALLGKWA